MPRREPPRPVARAPAQPAGRRAPLSVAEAEALRARLPDLAALDLTTRVLLRRLLAPYEPNPRDPIPTRAAWAATNGLKLSRASPHFVFGDRRPPKWPWVYPDGSDVWAGWLTPDREVWKRAGRVACVTSHPHELTDAAREVLTRLEHDLGVEVRVGASPSWIEGATLVECWAVRRQ